MGKNCDVSFIDLKKKNKQQTNYTSHWLALLYLVADCFL